ncbi:MAG: hypothetical protein ACC707_20075 [Thiohalomonadales bacterium]
MADSNIKKMAQDAREWAKTPEGKRAMREAIEAVLKRTSELKEKRRLNMDQSRRICR